MPADVCNRADSVRVVGGERKRLGGICTGMPVDISCLHISLYGRAALSI